MFSSATVVPSAAGQLVLELRRRQVGGTESHSWKEKVPDDGLELRYHFVPSLHLGLDLGQLNGMH